MMPRNYLTPLPRYTLKLGYHRHTFIVWCYPGRYRSRHTPGHPLLKLCFNSPCPCLPWYTLKLGYHRHTFIVWCYPERYRSRHPCLPRYTTAKDGGSADIAGANICHAIPGNRRYRLPASRDIHAILGNRRCRLPASRDIHAIPGNKKSPPYRWAKIRV